MQGIFLNKIRQWVVKFETIFISVFVFRKTFLRYWGWNDYNCAHQLLHLLLYIVGPSGHIHSKAKDNVLTTR